MKTQLTTLQNESRTCAMTEPVAGRKPVFALLMRLLWAAALALPAFGAQAAVVFTTLHSFQAFPNGANPQAALVQGSDGSFYGTTQSGGTNGYGTVFKISTNGALTSLYSFTGGNDGASPQAELVQGSDGYFYGTTYGFDPVAGAPVGFGTVFKMSTDGALTSLYSFTGGNDGANPSAGLVQGSDGNFYGTTSGGTYTNGTVFKISANGTLTSLYSFTGGNGGAKPKAALVQGSDGNFYGTTVFGGTKGFGTVFKISTTGTLTSLYSFGSVLDTYYGYSLDGAYPVAALVQGSDGYFYGTTYAYGQAGAGTVFKISTTGALTTLYSFTGGNDGGGPNGLVQGTDGNFYGTTGGTVFKIGTNGALTSLCSFTAIDGAGPSGLVQGRDGNFFGTTEYSYPGGFGWGPSGGGNVFKISASGALTNLYSFTGGNDGANPTAGLVQGSDGNFYGTTESFVFKISASGAYTSLTGGTDGAYPYPGLVQGSDGNFYGTTEQGGTNNAGTVFKISTNGARTSLYSFTGGTDGGSPEVGLVQGSDGYFYGTTYVGGTPNSPGHDGYGTVFKISTNGAITTLYSFTDGNDGAWPRAGLVQGSDGYFYGTTSFGGLYYTPGPYGFVGGTVFRISTNGALTTLYSFTGGTDGGSPQAGLVQGSDGYFYGTTGGTVFKISPTGALTTLHVFTGGNDGWGLFAGLVQGSDGNFYGTTLYGGTGSVELGCGTVFRISASGAYTSLYSFTDGTDGAYPYAGLVQGSDGNFYGTTSGIGEYVRRNGTVFRLTIVPEFQAMTLTNSTLSLSWSTEAGGTYQLQWNADLRSSNWTNLRGPVTAAGATLITTDSVTNAPRRFYRLVLSP